MALVAAWALVLKSPTGVEGETPVEVHATELA